MSIAINIPIIDRVGDKAQDIADSVMKPFVNTLQTLKNNFITPKGLKKNISKATGFDSLTPIIDMARELIPTIKINKSGKNKQSSNNIAKVKEEVLAKDSKVFLDIKDILSSGFLGLGQGLGAVIKSVDNVSFITESMATKAARLRLDTVRKNFLAEEAMQESLRAQEHTQDVLEKIAENTAISKIPKKDESSIFTGTLLGNLVANIFKKIPGLGAIASGLSFLTKSMAGLLAFVTAKTFRAGKGIGSVLGNVAKKIPGVNKLFGGIGAVTQNAGKMVSRAPSNLGSKVGLGSRLGGGAAIALNAYSAIKSFKNGDKLAKDYKIENPNIAALTNIISGRGKGGITSAFAQAGSLAIQWAGMGLVFGPVGALIGGLLGAAIGAITGFFGAEKVAGFFQQTYSTVTDTFSMLTDKVVSLFTSLTDWWSSWTWRDLVPGFLLDVIDGKITLGTISKSIEESFTSIFDDLIHTLKGAFLGIQKFYYDQLSNFGSGGTFIAKKIFGENFNKEYKDFNKSDSKPVAKTDQYKPMFDDVNTTQTKIKELEYNTVVKAQSARPPAVIDARSTSVINNSSGISMMAPKNSVNTESTLRRMQSDHF